MGNSPSRLSSFGARRRNLDDEAMPNTTPSLASSSEDLSTNLIEKVYAEPSSVNSVLPEELESHENSFRQGLLRITKRKRSRQAISNCSSSVTSSNSGENGQLNEEATESKVNTSNNNSSSTRSKSTKSLRTEKMDKSISKSNSIPFIRHRMNRLHSSLQRRANSSASMQETRNNGNAQNSLRSLESSTRSDTRTSSYTDLSNSGSNRSNRSLSQNRRFTIIERLFRNLSRPSSVDSLSNLFGNRPSSRNEDGAVTMSDRDTSNLSSLNGENEDHSGILSRLLSMAAAATAASLTNGNAEGAFSNVSDVDANHEEGERNSGSFEEFLQILRNGQLISALGRGRNESQVNNSEESSSDRPQGVIFGRQESLNFFRMFRFDPQPPPADAEPGTPATIPVIIVGVRAVPQPGRANELNENQHASLIDTFPSFSDIAEDMRRGSQQRIRTTEGNQNLVNSTTDSVPTDDLHSTGNEGENASINQSRANFIEQSLRDRLEANRNEQSRQNPRSAGTDSTDENANRARPARSWIIYVLGGNYPENHPILTTPSLFTDSPTYEDMVMLGSLIGNVKPPIATHEEVEASGLLENVIQGHRLLGERCLICLSDYTEGEVCRSLRACSHLFHKACIDEWLTTGRNSCPLCRCQGVKTKNLNPSEDQVSMETQA